MERMTTCGLLAACLVASFAVALQGSETPPATDQSTPLYELPDDPSVAVIEFRIGYGHMLRWRGPYEITLRVFADGRVIVGDPFGFANRRVGEKIQPNPDYVPTIEGRISGDELDALLKKALGEYRLLDFDSEAEIKRYSKIEALPVDANSESMTLRTKGKEHTCWLRAASVLSEADPEKFPYFKNFVAMANELRGLRQRVIDEYKTKAKAEIEKPAAVEPSSDERVAVVSQDQPVIIAYDVSSGNMFRKRSEPEQVQLIIRADGTVVIGDPFGGPDKPNGAKDPNYVATIEAKITPEEAQSLLQFIAVENDLTHFDSEADFKRYKAEYPVVADASSESLNFQLKDVDYHCWVYAPSVSVRTADPARYPYFKRFAAVSERMQQLRNRLIAEAKARPKK